MTGSQKAATKAVKRIYANSSDEDFGMMSDYTTPLRAAKNSQPANKRNKIAPKKKPSYKK